MRGDFVVLISASTLDGRSSGSLHHPALPPLLLHRLPFLEVPSGDVQQTLAESLQLLSSNGLSVTSQKMQLYPRQRPYRPKKAPLQMHSLFLGPCIASRTGLCSGLSGGGARTRVFPLEDCAVLWTDLFLWCPWCLPGQRRLGDLRAIKGNLKSSPALHLPSGRAVWQCWEGN